MAKLASQVSSEGHAGAAYHYQRADLRIGQEVAEGAHRAARRFVPRCHGGDDALGSGAQANLQQP